MKLCDLTDLDATGSFGVRSSGVQYMIVRAPGETEPRVYYNSCPHLGIALEMREHDFLDMGQEYIVCANHGALFQINDGLCVAGPCKNQSLKPASYTVDKGSVWLAS